MVPSDAALMAKAVRLFYVQGCTRVEIAKKLGLSRFKVARLLDHALATGVVTIQIRTDSLVDSEMSEALRQRLGLSQVLVVWSGGAVEARYENIGRATAQLLLDTTTGDDILGVDVGRTVSHVAPHLAGLLAPDIIQLGGLAGIPGETGLDIVRRVADANGGNPHPLYAPLLAGDAHDAAVMRRHPQVADTISRFHDVTKALVSIGSWRPPVSQVYDRLDPTDRDALVGLGVVAETCALMFDAEGHPVKELDDRRIGVDLDDLIAIPEVIAVGGGQDKAAAIVALGKSGAINTLVTDETAAQAILNPPKRTRRSAEHPSDA